jgi:RNA polymerase primary sigma factor
MMGKLPRDDDPLKRYLRELATIQPLTKDEETDCLFHVQAHDKEEELASKRLIEANLPLVASIAKQYSSSGIPMLSLIQEGNLGLMTALRTFAESRGTFTDHAATCIKDAISKAITES